MEREREIVDIEVMFKNGTIRKFRALRYEEYGEKNYIQYYIYLEGGKRVVIDNKDVFYIELPYLNYKTKER
jgi:hypothetical protein